MLIGIFFCICGFVIGIGAAFYVLRMNRRKNKAQVDFLTNDIVRNLENILHDYRNNYHFQRIVYKPSDLMKRDVWHNKFLIEKFFLITGLYETDRSGRISIRSNADANLIKRFLAEVQNGDFNKLLEIVADIPAGAFYLNTISGQS